MIAFLALRPVRLGNLAGMRLGQQVLIDRGAVTVAFSAGEVKNRQPLEFPWPAPPAGAAAGLPGAVSAATPGRPIACGPVGLAPGRGVHAQAMPVLAGEANPEPLGQPVGPHLFRDCAATTIALLAPKRRGSSVPFLATRIRRSPPGTTIMPARWWRPRPIRPAFSPCGPAGIRIGPPPWKRSSRCAPPFTPATPATTSATPRSRTRSGCAGSGSSGRAGAWCRPMPTAS